MATIKVSCERSDAFMENLCAKGLIDVVGSFPDVHFEDSNGQTIPQHEVRNFQATDPWVQLTYEYLRIDGDFIFTIADGIWFHDDPIGYTDLVVEVLP